MLVAKLDLAQYIAVRSFVDFLGSKLQAFLQNIKQQPNAEQSGGGDSNDMVDLGGRGREPRIQPAYGRMPNASGNSFVSFSSLLDFPSDQ
jgi:hypothetical protein